MARRFANIIVDISHEKLDKIFQYEIPESLNLQIEIGMLVNIPFGAGNRQMKGYVVGITEKADYEISKIKPILGLVSKGISIESQFIRLAWWMKEQYGSTMNQALKTVIPIKRQIKQKEKKIIQNKMTKEELEEELLIAKKKNYKARERLFQAFFDQPFLPYEIAEKQLGITMAVLKPLIAKGNIVVSMESVYRNPVSSKTEKIKPCILNREQSQITEAVKDDIRKSIRKTYLIHGITGSGKTEVYMELIEFVVNQGQQAIVLIPEIALTYQTVIRFSGRFGDRISIMNSKLSAGERYDQFLRAQNGEIDIMIGPRSALFTPFSNLGLIIIDEEHEGAYKSEVSPRYHARETAIERARMNNACVVLGSATPSVESYYRAKTGQYQLFELTKRAKEQSELAHVSIVDLREELKQGNKSIFSRELSAFITDRLHKKEQIMLFLNRRGYAGFISCRACGTAMKCPHCDISLTAHKDARLHCHYCGFEQPMPTVCPVCHSSYIAAFGVGTQKVEVMIQKEFPQARVLRMDMDTTSKKGGHEDILSAFSTNKADILVGTQMIVKGHDFPNVTLVGVIAADLSLFSSDFKASERTFQLLTQAAGRAGRSHLLGHVIIQTYNPQHYSIRSAASQDYKGFFEQEMLYRSMLNYPPVCSMLAILVASKEEPLAQHAILHFASEIENWSTDGSLQMIGPGKAPLSKISDVYRKILYIKHSNYNTLIQIKNHLEQLQENFHGVMIQFDFS